MVSTVSLHVTVVDLKDSGKYTIMTQRVGRFSDTVPVVESRPKHSSNTVSLHVPVVECQPK